MIHNNLLLIAFHFHINFLNLLILLESFCFGELLFTSTLHDGFKEVNYLGFYHRYTSGQI